MLLSINYSASWSDAVQACEARDGHLVTASTRQEQLELESWIEEAGLTEPVWLNARMEDESLIGDHQTLWRWIGD